MGRPNASDQTRILHFSHPHPLHPTYFQTLPRNSTCSACNLHDPIGPVYACTPCNFVLHIKCYQLPRQMRHSFDPNHTLVLQPKPVYPSGLFTCDACRNPGPGFSYSCGPCGVHLHTTCARLPIQLTHGTHHHHKLRLCVSAYYRGLTVGCDVCKRVGSGSWMYRCDTCNFDAHLTCCVARLVPIQENRSRPGLRPPPIFGAHRVRPGLRPPPIFGAHRGRPRLRPPPIVGAHRGHPGGYSDGDGGGEDDYDSGVDGGYSHRDGSY